VSIPNYNLYEAISYRAISFVITFNITWAITGSWKAALSIGPIDQLFKFGVYYYHRKGWDAFSSRKVTEYWATVDTEVYGDNSEEDDDE